MQKKKKYSWRTCGNNLYSIPFVHGIEDEFHAQGAEQLCDCVNYLGVKKLGTRSVERSAEVDCVKAGLMP